MTPIEIAAVTGDPPEGLAALLEEARTNGVGFMAFLPEELRRRQGRFGPGEALFAARQGEVLAAVAVISADPYVADAVTGRLRFIYVRDAFRRRGLARRLVRACLDHAAGHWQRLTLHTDNPAAAELYRRFGFAPLASGGRATHALTCADNH